MGWRKDLFLKRSTGHCKNKIGHKRQHNEATKREYALELWANFHIAELSIADLSAYLASQVHIACSNNREQSSMCREVRLANLVVAPPTLQAHYQKLAD